jgi:hypothetical protein
MKLRGFCLSVLSVLILPFLASDAFADTLGSASSFAVLGEAGVTNAGVGTLGATIITGDLGGSQGTPAVTGFPPGIVNGTIFTTGAPNQAFSDLTTAYNTLAGLTPNATLLPDLGGLTLSPGVYAVPAGTTNLSGVLTLDDKGVGGSRFVFQLSSTLITSPNSSIDVSKLHLNDQVFFVVGSAATLGDNSDFIGNILALDQIAFDPGATDLCGRALSKTASVTFAGQNPTTGEQNEVSIGCSAVTIGGGGNGGGSGSGGGLGGGTTGVAEPSTLSLLLGGLISFGFLSKRLLLS